MASERSNDEALTSHSYPRHRWSYDVFLSFRGEDTRKNFADHLYTALIDAGIDAFRDDNELRRGEDISTELLKAIQESRISLIVFSRNYADSRWCLEELVRIMECKKRFQQVVLPVFYDVNPSDVRKQRGIFGEAFAKLEKRSAAAMDKVFKWRAALTEAANLSGWDLTSAEYGYEAKTIKAIVAKILNHLDETYLDVALHPVGIDSRVRYMNSLLRVGLDDVRLVGICAMGGMGKTTIAKAVYNQFYLAFEGKSFLANVREIAEDPDGLVHLQEKLLLDVLKTEKIKIGNVGRGINLIRKRLCNKRVLLVLDDVDQLEQLNAIARKRDWFGLGSRIIITTRDEQLLKQIKVDETYMVGEMNNDQSLELFGWHAFKECHPEKEYAELSQDIIGYCKGLPLALEVLGSFLCGRSIPEWKSALAKLKKIPNDQIQKKLRVSFDALDEDEKEIFLDIACFFIGVDKDYVAKILDGCDFSVEIGIKVLFERSLLKITKDNKLMIHDLLRDMGRKIVREKYPKEPGKRSRLWFNEDVINVLTKNKGTTKIEGIILNLPSSNEVQFSTKAFANMDKLRLLQLNYVCLIGDDYGHLSKELRWLCWHGFPLKFIPNNFHLENLIAMDMQHSKLRQVWKETKFLGKLKVLDLSHSHYLTKTPDFSQLPDLEKLLLEDCTSLGEVHPSIGCLDGLVLMNMRDCKHLRNLPKTICKLKSLEFLNLSGCSELEKLPEGLGEMKALTTLLADGTAIGRVSLRNLKNLSLLGYIRLPSTSWASYLWSWARTLLSTSIFKSLIRPSLLTRLSLEDCNLSEDHLPNDLGILSSLESLDLRRNDFQSLPDSISNLPNLIRLELDNCRRLRALPELPTSLRLLNAQDCISLDRVPDLSKFEQTPWLFLTNCNKLVEIPGLEKSQSFRIIRLEGCSNLANTVKETLLQFSQVGHGTIVLPGSEIPNWFRYRFVGSSSLSVQTPPTSKVKGLIFCIVYSWKGVWQQYSSESPFGYDNIPVEFAELGKNLVESLSFVEVIVTNKTKKMKRHYTLWTADFVVSIEDHLLTCPMLPCEWDGGDEVEVQPPSIYGFQLESGFNLIYEDDQAESIQSAGPDVADVNRDDADVGDDHRPREGMWLQKVFVCERILRERGRNFYSPSALTTDPALESLTRATNYDTIVYNPSPISET